MVTEEELINLPEDVFRLLRDLIADYCGIFFEDDSKHLLERKLNARLKANGLDNFRDYFRFLLYDRRRDDELSSVVDVLTVNETYFFREPRQIKAFAEEICEELKALKSDARKIRIWSAGCASGEEPYTIAMLVLERAPLFKGWDVEIVGSDINRRVLQKARNGVYRKSSFRATDGYFLNKYFLTEGDSYRIKDEVKRLVNFNCLNLMDPCKAHLVGVMDVIFCRNVLMYFHLNAKKRVVDHFYSRLFDGGYLLLGHAESLINVSTAFSLKHFKNDMVYQKPRASGVSMSNESLLRMVWRR